MGATACFNCDKGAPFMNNEDMKETCGSCREVLKAELVRAVLELDPIYLNETNRNKKGRPPKLTADQKHDIKYRYWNERQKKRAGLIKHASTYKELAKEYTTKDKTISAHLIKKIVHNEDI